MQISSLFTTATLLLASAAMTGASIPGNTSYHRCLTPTDRLSPKTWLESRRGGGFKGFGKGSSRAGGGGGAHGSGSGHQALVAQAMWTMAASVAVGVAMVGV